MNVVSKFARFLLAVALSLAAFRAEAGAADSPRLLSPPDGMDLTDVATYFRWVPVGACTNYEIQIAHDRDFKDPVRSRQTRNKGFHQNCWFPREVLPAGAYAWRVRALRGTEALPWSGAFAFTVNTNRAVTPEVVRAIGPEHPLFLMRSRTWDPLLHAEHVKEIIPAGLEHVIVVDDIALASEKVLERAARYQQLGVDFVIWNNRCQVPLATIEYLFQRFSRCIGTAEGEHFDGMYWERGPEGNLSESDFVHRAWTLCGKYGRFYFFADGDAGYYRWPGFAEREKEAIARYGRNIVPMFKTTKGDVALHSWGAVQGLMVAGGAENCGTWADEWIWPGCGFGKLGELIPEERIWDNRRKVGTRQCPWTYDLQMWLMGIASGSTVFQLESAHQWSPEGKGQANYARYFLPFVRAVVEHGLLPSRQAFLDSIKLAVVSDPELAKGKHQKQYTGGYAFLNHLYALQAPGDQELIPNNSRYGIVCMLPPGTASIPPGMRVLQQKDLLDAGRAAEVFDACYPARFGGDAFMWECDGTAIVTDSNENQDLGQRFVMPFGSGLVRQWSGSVGVHQYLIGKLAPDGRGFWFQTNGEYTNRGVEVSMVCERKPEWQIAPASAAKGAGWDEAARTLTLRLSHELGAVEVSLK